jgi:hypothetical protein
VSWSGSIKVVKELCILRWCCGLSECVLDRTARAGDVGIYVCALIAKGTKMSVSLRTF